MNIKSKFNKISPPVQEFYQQPHAKQYHKVKTSSYLLVHAHQQLNQLPMARSLPLYQRGTPAMKGAQLLHRWNIYLHGLESPEHSPNKITQTKK